MTFLRVKSLGLTLTPKERSKRGMYKHLVDLCADSWLVMRKPGRTPGSCLLMLVSFVSLMTLPGCEAKRSAPPPTEVEITSPLLRDVPVDSEWIGTTVGYIDAEIHSKVTGYLLSQNYKEGTLVNKGDLLFQVDPRPFQALVDQGAAQLNVAQAELTQANADVTAANAEIDRAEAAQLKTQLDVKRYGPLVADGTVSHQEMDDAVQSNLANLASVAAAKGKRDRAKAAVTASEAQVGVARSSLQGAELNLGFTHISSPISGLAGIRVANIGDLVGGGAKDLLTTVSQIDPIYVEFPISEQEYLGLRSIFLTEANRQRSNLELILSDGSIYPLKGKLDIVGREVEASTGTLRLRGVFPNPNRILRPGQYSRVRAATRVEKDALLIPQRSVQELQGEYEVAVVDGNSQVAFRKVQAENRVGSYWVIKQGLQPSDRVVVEGLQKIKTGDTVEAKPAKLPPLLSDEPETN